MLEAQQFCYCRKTNWSWRKYHVVRTAVLLCCNNKSEFLGIPKQHHRFAFKLLSIMELSFLWVECCATFLHITASLPTKQVSNTCQNLKVHQCGSWNMTITGVYFPHILAHVMDMLESAIPIGVTLHARNAYSYTTLASLWWIGRNTSPRAFSITVAIAMKYH